MLLKRSSATSRGAVFRHKNLQARSTENRNLKNRGEVLQTVGAMYQEILDARLVQRNSNSCAPKRNLITRVRRLACPRQGRAQVPRKALALPDHGRHTPRGPLRRRESVAPAQEARVVVQQPRLSQTIDFRSRRLDTLEAPVNTLVGVSNATARTTY